MSHVQLGPGDKFLLNFSVGKSGRNCTVCMRYAFWHYTGNMWGSLLPHYAAYITEGDSLATVWKFGN
jgi:hypothetical protein